MASDRVHRQIDLLLDEAEVAIKNEDWSTVGSRARSVLAVDLENRDELAYLAAAERAKRWTTLRTPWPSAAKLATSPSWLGVAATTLTLFFNATA